MIEIYGDRLGACCEQENCTFLIESECINGTYQGDSTTCSPVNDCLIPTSTGNSTTGTDDVDGGTDTNPGSTTNGDGGTDTDGDGGNDGDGQTSSTAERAPFIRKISLCYPWS